MQSVLGISPRLLLAALMAGALATTVGFGARAPGQPLAPLDGAAQVIRLVQGEQSILWTTLSGTVETYRVQGWPTSAGDVQLGGAVMLEKVSADAGIISFGERPMSLEFELAG